MLFININSMNKKYDTDKNINTNTVTTPLNDGSFISPTIIIYKPNNNIDCPITNPPIINIDNNISYVV